MGIQFLIELGLALSVSFFLFALFQKLEKPKQGIVKYALGFRIAYILGVFLSIVLALTKNEKFYQLMGNHAPLFLWLLALTVAFGAFAVNHFQVNYDGDGIIHKGWFSAPCRIAWEDVQKIQRGKIDKSEILIVTPLRQYKINDVWLNVGVKGFLQAVQNYAPDCTIDERIRSNYEI